MGGLQRDNRIAQDGGGRRGSPLDEDDHSTPGVQGPPSPNVTKATHSGVHGYHITDILMYSDTRSLGCRGGGRRLGRR